MAEIVLRLSSVVATRLLGGNDLVDALRSMVFADLAAVTEDAEPGAPGTGLRALGRLVARRAEQLGLRGASAVAGIDARLTAAPVELRLDGRVLVPSTSSWVRASAAARGKFPRTDEIAGSIAGALLAPGVDSATLLVGLVELCVDTLHHVVDGHARAATGGAAPLLVLTLAPEDFVELHHAAAPEAMASELTRLVWEASGVPLTVRFEIDPAHGAGAVGVVLGGVIERVIPLLPAGAALSRSVMTGEQVLLLAGNAFWLGEASAFAHDPNLIDRSWALALCLFDLCRERVARLAGPLTIDELHRIASRSCPQGLALAVDQLGRDTLDAVLAALLRAETPLGDLRAVFQALIEYVAPLDTGGQVFAFGNAPSTERETGRVPLLVRHVRARLGARIVALLTGGETTLPAHVVSPAWVNEAAGELAPALDDQLRAGLRELGAVGFGGASWRTALVTTAELRAHVAEVVRGEFPHVSVIAFDEVPPWVTLQVLSTSVGGAVVHALPKRDGSIIVDGETLTIKELVEDASALAGEPAEVESE